MEIEKGFRKWIYESGFVEKEEFYDKFRNSPVIYDKTLRVSWTPELCGVWICIQVDYIFLSHARGIDEYAFQAGHLILQGYVSSG